MILGPETIAALVAGASAVGAFAGGVLRIWSGAPKLDQRMERVLAKLMRDAGSQASANRGDLTALLDAKFAQIDLRFHRLETKQRDEQLQLGALLDSKIRPLVDRIYQFESRCAAMACRWSSPGEDTPTPPDRPGNR